MNKEHINLVFAGHVDHGKSTLIGRILYDTNSLPEGLMEEIEKTSKEMNIEPEFAYILDSLEEERIQNVTIDTTQIYFKTEKKDFTIIDAPGHREFLKNMITGASLADAAILLIDAKQGLKEQTTRHARILSMLGIKQIVVAINKMDLVNYEQERFESLSLEIKKFLNDLNLKTDHIVPISSKLGENINKKSNYMKWYHQETIIEALEKLTPLSTSVLTNPILPVQDIYKINDKRVIVGRMISGKLVQGQEIGFYPSGNKTKVESILKFPNETSYALSGESIGITLQDPLYIERGQILSNDVLNSSKEFNATIFLLDKEELKVGDKINLKCSVQECNAIIKEITSVINSSTLEKIEKNTISETQIAQVKIKTEKPIITYDFSLIPELGRFVLEKEEVIACGIIL